MRISIIAAIGKHRELGKNNKLLWNIPKDMRRFRKLTSGHVVIMGRKTFESIGKPLPNRINIIVTRDRKFNESVLMNQLINTFVVHSVEKAIETAKKYEKNEIFIIGGGEIYKQTIPLVNKLYLTIVKSDSDADVFFPDYSNFKKVTYRKEEKEGNLEFTFVELER